MQARGELGQLLGPLLGMGPGLRIPVQAQGRDDLLDQGCLPVGGGFHGPQVPRLDSRAAQFGHQSGDAHRPGVVVPLGQRADQPVRLPFGEFLLADLGGGQELRPADAADGGGAGVGLLGLALPADAGERVLLAALDGVEVLLDDLEGR